MRLVELKKHEIVLLPDINVKDKIKSKKQEIKRNMELRQRINRLGYQWKSVMAHTKTHNQLKQTFTLTHIEEKDYGYKCRILSPDGLALEKLNDLKEQIESGLKCIFVVEIPEHKAFAMTQIIKPNQIKVNEIPFEPVKVKPYELYFGVKITGTDNPVIFNVNNTPHALIAGQQRRGKNCSGDHAITSLIHSCTDREVEFIMFQGAKNDLIKYKHCEHVKAFVLGNFEEFLLVLQHIKQEMNRRTELLVPMVSHMKGDNIFHYNKQNSKENRLSYIYIVIDEFPSLMPLNCDCKHVKEIKNNILDLLFDVGRWGGALGINYIIYHQKPEKELMPSFIKNQSSIRVSFGFDDQICSQIVLGNDLAWKLPARRAYYSADGKTDLLFTTNIQGRLEQYLKPHFKVGHRTIFDIIESEKTKINTATSTKTSKQKSSPTDFSKVTKTKEEILRENISKIPGWVEWEGDKK